MPEFRLNSNIWNVSLKLPQVSDESRGDMDREEEMPTEQSSYLAAATVLEEQEAVTVNWCL